MPCSAAILRTSGLDLERRLSSTLSSVVVLAAAAGAGAAACSTSLAAASGAALLSSLLDADSPSAPMTATTVPTSTVEPASTLISSKIPSAGEGISASTLSVDISKRASSRSTRSPTAFNQVVIVPSAIDSPIWGSTTSCATESPPCTASRGAPPIRFGAQLKP